MELATQRIIYLSVLFFFPTIYNTTHLLTGPFSNSQRAQTPVHPFCIPSLFSPKLSTHLLLNFVTRSKGLTEEALASIGYSDTIIFRPGLLAGVHRREPRIAESVLR